MPNRTTHIDDSQFLFRSRFHDCLRHGDNYAYGIHAPPRLQRHRCQQFLEEHFFGCWRYSSESAHQCDWQRVDVHDFGTCGVGQWNCVYLEYEEVWDEMDGGDGRADEG